MKYSEIKDLTTKEIKEMIKEEEVSLVKLKITHKVSDIDNPLNIRESRRKIARLHTELRKRELGQN